MSSSVYFTTENPNTTVDGMKDVCIAAKTYSVGLVLAAILQGSLVVLGNVLVLVVLCRYPPRQFTALNWLLGHLAIADIIIGAITIWWFGISQEFAIPLRLNDTLALNNVGIVAVLASFEGLAMIALDRYLLILHPFKYPSIVTRKRLLIALVMMWLVPIIIHLVIPLSGWSCVDSCDCRIYNRNPNANSCTGGKCSQISPPLTTLQLLLAGVMGLLSFCVTVTLYVIMFCRIRKSTKKTKILLNPQQISNKSLISSKTQCAKPNPCTTERPGTPRLPGHDTKERKWPVISRTSNIQSTKARRQKAFKKRDVAVMKSLFIIMSVFSITTLPLMFVMMFIYINNEPSYRNVVNYSSQVAILNSLVNPFLYFWRIPTMQQGLIKLLHLQRCHPNCLFRADRRRSNTTK